MYKPTPDHVTSTWEALRQDTAEPDTLDAVWREIRLRELRQALADTLYLLPGGIDCWKEFLHLTAQEHRMHIRTAYAAGARGATPPMPAREFLMDPATGHTVIPIEWPEVNAALTPGKNN